jgi:hypothetical protein
MEPHEQRGEPQAGERDDFLARHLLELEENEKGTVLLRQPIEHSMHGLTGLSALELIDRRRGRSWPLVAKVNEMNPAQPSPHTLTTSSGLNDPSRNLIEPGRDLSLTTKLRQAALNYQEHVVDGVLDIDCRATEVRYPPPHPMGVCSVKVV